jgi:hypothetical protein
MLVPSLAPAATLPSRDAAVVIPLLQHAAPDGGLARVETILGAPDASFVSGFRIYVFHLNDSTSLYVSSPDRHRVFGIRRSAPGSDAETLYEPLGADLMRPPPRSAPF